MIFDRRTVLTAGTAALIIGKTTTAKAQDSEYPPLSDTLAILEDERRSARLYNRFKLAYFLAVEMLLKKDPNANPSPNDEEERKVEDVFNLLFSLGRVDGKRDEIIRKLNEIGEDPIFKFEKSHMSLIVRFGEEIGGVPEEGLLAPALDSLTHVERIAAAEITENDGSSFVCQLFPFKQQWFCQ